MRKVTSARAPPQLVLTVDKVNILCARLCCSLWVQVGWLTKQGERVRNWKQRHVPVCDALAHPRLPLPPPPPPAFSPFPRWFVLRGQSLDYFASPKEASPRMSRFLFLVGVVCSGPTDSWSHPRWQHSGGHPGAGSLQPGAYRSPAALRRAPRRRYRRGTRYAMGCGGQLLVRLQYRGPSLLLNAGRTLNQAVVDRQGDGHHGRSSQRPHLRHGQGKCRPRMAPDGPRRPATRFGWAWTAEGCGNWRPRGARCCSTCPRRTWASSAPCWWWSGGCALPLPCRSRGPPAGDHRMLRPWEETGSSWRTPSGARTCLGCCGSQGRPRGRPCWYAWALVALSHLLFGLTSTCQELRLQSPVGALCRVEDHVWGRQRPLLHPFSVASP